jgi:hypothetical protein
VGMDLDLRDELSRGFGPEPAHRPVADRIGAGRRVVRRRRLAAVSISLVVATALGVGWTAFGVGPGGAPVANTDRGLVHDHTDRQVIRTASRNARDLTRAVNYANGVLRVDDSVTVLRTSVNPFGWHAPNRSRALEISWRGRTWWVVVSWQDEGDGFSMGIGHPGEAPTFESWLRQQVVHSRIIERGDQYRPLPPIEFTIEPGDGH